MTSNAKQGKDKDKDERDDGKGRSTGTERSGDAADTNRPNPIDLQRHLKGVDYPARRDDLVAKARDAGAGEDIVRALESIPDREYEDPAQVSEAVAKKR
jgi:hypothetical protein